MPFRIGEHYGRLEVQELLGIDEPTTSGDWGTGYTEFGGEFFIFANVGTAGRTGHDYPNEWDGDVFHWAAKGRTTLAQPQIRRLMEPGRVCHVFTRTHGRAPFTYHGRAQPLDARGERPVMFTWVFGSPPRGAEDRSRGLHGDYRWARGGGGGEDAAVNLRRNPALVERALASHAAGQNDLADEVRRIGWTPLSPTGPVDYDLAWREPGGLSVAEVKSLTDANEVSQLRLGVGQLLDYAAALDARGEPVHRLVLAVEREPSSVEHWRRVCERAGIELVWGPRPRLQ